MIGFRITLELVVIAVVDGVVVVDPALLVSKRFETALRKSSYMRPIPMIASWS